MSEPEGSISQTIDHAEGVVGAALAAELGEHFQLARDVTDLAGDLIERVSEAPGSPRALHVSTVLIARILTDLRAVCHLIRRGYVEQALSLTAGMMELAHVSMYIGTDEERADKWLMHANPKQGSPWDLKTMIRGVAQVLGVSEEIMEREYDTVYRDMNLTKHGNPMALASTTVEHRGDAIFILAGPHLSEPGRRLAHAAMLYGVRYTYLPSVKYIHDHVPSIDRPPIFVAWKAVSNKLTELIDATRRTFASEDTPSDETPPGTSPSS
jgi:hypothetical protein